jgi:uncharacterized protein YbaR (Trm112 family)
MARKTAGSEKNFTVEITQKQLAWLVCPVCRSSLYLAETTELAARHIHCEGCGRDFPILDGLPILLANR